MHYITDLHIHSRYSRACSKNLTLSNLAAWAQVKGIDVLGTGDFTHPKWFADIETKLVEAEPGLFKLRSEFEAQDGEANYMRAPIVRDGRPVRFVLTSELSCIYKKGGKTRRIHVLVFAPSIDAVKKIIAELERRECNVRSDGRPILGLEAKEVARIAFEADAWCVVVPAHAWTPWFSIFGSESGFDSLEECFEELTPQIFAIETGLSSDPLMNRRLSALDTIALISNSDAHGLANLGREANVFDLRQLSYDAIMSAIKTRDQKKFLYTIEFFPEEGKYHVDGHRLCNFFCLPEETVRRGGLCPKCGKGLTRGVLGRVHVLADRASDQQFPSSAVGFRSIVPLPELIAEAIDKGKTSKAVTQIYHDIITQCGAEFTVLLDTSIQDIKKISSEVADAIEKMRHGDLDIRPGYDGIFGEIRLKQKKKVAQGRLVLE